MVGVAEPSGSGRAWTVTPTNPRIIKQPEPNRAEEHNALKQGTTVDPMLGEKYYG